MKKKLFAEFKQKMVASIKIFFYFYFCQRKKILLLLKAHVESHTHSFEFNNRKHLDSQLFFLFVFLDNNMLIN